jgi:hypothetical protein
VSGAPLSLAGVARERKIAVTDRWEVILSTTPSRRALFRPVSAVSTL